jgi:hypothetical protein
MSEVMNQRNERTHNTIPTKDQSSSHKEMKLYNNLKIVMVSLLFIAKSFMNKLSFPGWA